MLLNWKSDHPLSFGRWIYEDMHFLKIEKKTPLGSITKIDAVWQPFISYVEHFTLPIERGFALDMHITF